jgi:hypothetical protein
MAWHDRGGAGANALTMLDRLFLDHPREQGETYGEHARFAASVGWRMTLGGLGCLVHAVLPFAFPTLGGRTIRDLHGRLSSRRVA